MFHHSSVDKKFNSNLDQSKMTNVFHAFCSGHWVRKMCEIWQSSVAVVRSSVGF